MNDLQLWMPKLTNLSPLIVVKNGTEDTCRVRGVDEDRWQDKPNSILDYYRPATTEEAARLLLTAA